ncbi:response regulator [candidate division KSB1 bacterium]|nr:response regulator [candidate division KSB1 bacterium]
MALNVLVVDDSSVMRSMIIKTLRLCGVDLSEVHEASNGQEGLAILRDHWVDLALIDINMPVMNGEQMIEHIKSNPDTEDLAVIVVSTESSETRIDKLLDKGVQFIHKPFTPETLREIILTTVGGLDEQ